MIPLILIGIGIVAAGVALAPHLLVILAAAFSIGWKIALALAVIVPFHIWREKKASKRLLDEAGEKVDRMYEVAREQVTARLLAQHQPHFQ